MVAALPVGPAAGAGVGAEVVGAAAAVGAAGVAIQGQSADCYIVSTRSEVVKSRPPDGYIVEGRTRGIAACVLTEKRIGRACGTCTRAIAHLSRKGQGTETKQGDKKWS